MRNRTEKKRMSEELDGKKITMSEELYQGLKKMTSV